MARHPRRSGFLLLEVLFATVLVGMTIAALLAANASVTTVNGHGANLTQAVFLCEQIRELTASLPAVDTGGAAFGPNGATLPSFNSVEDFDGASFTPPIDADRNALNDLGAFTQSVLVQCVSRNDFDTVVSDYTSDFLRVTVSVTYAGQTLSTIRWIHAVE